MITRERFIKFLLKPPLWLCITVWSVGAAALAGSIALYYSGLGGEPWALSVHILALVLCIASLYAVLAVIGIPDKAKDNVKIQSFFASYNTRAFVYATISAVLNLCYVAFGIVVACVTHSAWLGVLVGYHVFLFVPRLIVLYTARVRVRRAGADENKQQLRAYAHCGLALVMLALALVPVIRLTINDLNSYNYFVSAVVYVTAIAAYTFTKMGISLYNLKKVRKQSDMSLIAVKNISFADALISVFALQAMMLKELNIGSDAAALAAKLNPIVGAIVSAAIAAIGLHMIIRGRKMLKAYDDGGAADDERGDA